MMTTDIIAPLHEKLKTLPLSPGVYFFKNAAHTIIYIGKAKSLRKRVSNYFSSRAYTDEKTAALMTHVRHIDYMTTATEQEALLWENTLIKRFAPKYNIDLKDDKTYPYLVLVNNPYPYLQVTRRCVNDGSEYYGPYIDVQTLRAILRLVEQLFPIRKCRGALSLRKKACLHYHLGHCVAPCINPIHRRAYRTIVNEMKAFLRGKYTLLQRKWEKEIAELSKALRFEEAAVIKKKRDVLLRMKQFHVTLWHVDEEKVRAMVEHTQNTMLSLETALGVHTPIHVIAGFDISNVGGKYAVGSRVVFVDSEPDKNRYRRYKIKYTPHEPNDVAMMREVFARCMRSDDTDTIDLFLIDGGKGQVNAAFDEMQKAGKQGVVIGLAKQEELIYFPGQKEPLRIDPKQKALHLLMRVRDEAHRFAVAYHRLLRRKEFLIKKGSAKAALE